MAKETIIKKINEKPSKQVINLKTDDKAELRLIAETLAKIYTDAVQNAVYSSDIEITSAEGDTIVTTVREAMETAVNKYVAISRNECFNALRVTDDPMLNAVKQLTYPTIRIVDKDGKKDGSELPKTYIDNGEKCIDLLKLHNSIDGGIGKDKSWARRIEKLNFLLTIQKAKELGINPTKINDSYAMSDFAKQIDLGENPVSKTNLLKTVQGIVTAMIGEEYKATSHDVNFLTSVYSRKSRKALTVNCANHKYMRQYMAEICHHIVLKGSYGLEYKAVKKA